MTGFFFTYFGGLGYFYCKLEILPNYEQTIKD
jgi:hypothetical protein